MSQLVLLGTVASTQHTQQHYQRGMPIRLEPDTFLALSRGVVAQSVLHADGTEVLLRLYGPGQLSPAEVYTAQLHAMRS